MILYNLATGQKRSSTLKHLFQHRSALASIGTRKLDNERVSFVATFERHGVPTTELRGIIDARALSPFIGCQHPQYTLYSF